MRRVAGDLSNGKAPGLDNLLYSADAEFSCFAVRACVCVRALCILSVVGWVCGRRTCVRCCCCLRALFFWSVVALVGGVRACVCVPACVVFVACEDPSFPPHPIHLPPPHLHPTIRWIARTWLTTPCFPISSTVPFPSIHPPTRWTGSSRFSLSTATHTHPYIHQHRTWR